MGHRPSPLNLNSTSGVNWPPHLLSIFPNLYYLELSSNSFTLNFSFDSFPPFKLIDLYLRSCKLGPNFPNWIRTQRNLIFLDLSNTGISNTIPTWFWDMPFELNCLNLSRNQIKGRLPNASSIFSDLATNLKAYYQ